MLLAAAVSRLAKSKLGAPALVSCCASLKLGTPPAKSDLPDCVNKAFSINEIAYTIKKILKYKCKIINNRKYPDGAPLKQLSNLKFKKYFNKFKFTNFELAIKNTIKAYLKKT